LRAHDDEREVLLRSRDARLAGKGLAQDALGVSRAQCVW
jgi:hypothetical protein